MLRLIPLLDAAEELSRLLEEVDLLVRILTDEDVGELNGDHHVEEEGLVIVLVVPLFRANHRQSQEAQEIFAVGDVTQNHLLVDGD